MPKDIDSKDAAICMSCTTKLGNDTLCCEQCDAMYCSAQCCKNESYWHDAVCLSLKSFSKQPVPNPTHGFYKRAICFPDDQKYPGFAWGNISTDPGHHLLDITKPQLGGLIGAAPNLGKMEIRNIKGSHFRHDNPHYDLFFSHKGGPDIKNTAMNKSVATFVQQGPLQYCWRGPIEIRKKGGIGGRRSDDMTMRDVRNVIDILKEIGVYRHKDDSGPDSIWVQIHALETQATQARQVLCTKISSKADINNFRAEQFAPLYIPNDLPAIKTAQTLQLSERLGLPLFMWRYPSTFPYDNLESGKRLHENRMAGYLLLGSDPTDPTWSDDSLWKYPSTVVVMRKDGKDLDPHHTEVLCDYCKGIVDFAEKNLDFGKAPLSRKQMDQERKNLDTITKANFEKRLDWYRNDKIHKQKDKSWENTISPFQV